MSGFINEARFKHALAYASENYFSKPYSITKMCDRWFNQRAIIQFENGELLHLTGAVALEYVDIICDGKPISKEDVKNVLAFHSQKSNYEEVETKLRTKIDELKSSKDPLSDDKTKQLHELTSLLDKLPQKEKEADELYDKIVANGALKINVDALEKKYSSKVKSIAHKPNHGYAHSIRTAYAVTALDDFNNTYSTSPSTFIEKEKELEKLQLMMLFSVVGRQDETGFADCTSSGDSTYEYFRSRSGAAYLEYFQQNPDMLEALYGKENMDSLYRDCIIIELMGYSDINEAIDSKNPETINLFVQYVKYREELEGKTCTLEDARCKVMSKEYKLINLFPSSETSYDAKLAMMNDAHSIDLIRCYTLYPTKEGGSSAIGILHYKLEEAGFFKTIKKRPFNEALEKLALNQLEDCFSMLRNTYDLMLATGQKTTFGMPSHDLFDAQKQSLLNDLKTMYQRSRQRGGLAKIKQEIIKKDSLDETKKIDGKGLRDAYLKKVDIFKCLVVHIADFFNESPKLQYTSKMFDFQGVDKENIPIVDHHSNAEKALKILKDVGPFASSKGRPLITNVVYDSQNNKKIITLNNKQAALQFIATYKKEFNQDLNYIKNNAEYTLTVDPKHLSKLAALRMVTFQQVKIPKTVSSDDDLIDKQGNIQPLQMIKHSRALGRLVSTKSLAGEDFPDYEYFFNALENPTTNRYIGSLRDDERFPIDYGTYHDPRDGVIITREVAKQALPLQFQEPITAPVSLTQKKAQGWQVSYATTKNTIFTPKLAHSLIPPHGKMLPFEGYPSSRSNFFPIGVISNIEQVDLKDERYIWSENMNTVNKAWLRDPKRFYTEINRSLDSLSLKQNTKTSQTTRVILEHAENRLQYVAQLLDNRYFYPPKRFLKDCQERLIELKDAYLKHVAENDGATQQVTLLYDKTLERVSQEINRQHKKYAISKRELIELQQKDSKAQAHNEILASNTKTAVKAFYCPKDDLFYRLNVVSHAKRIKEKYGYQVPIVVLSETNEPYFYSEQHLKDDLKKAIEKVRASQFPYDESEYVAYKLDDKGAPIKDENGLPIKDVDANGHVRKIIKNKAYQQQILTDLFRLAYPEVRLEDIEKGSFDIKPTAPFAETQHINLDHNINVMVDAISDELAIVGSHKNEQIRVENILNEGHEENIEKLLIREQKLGHQDLIFKILLSEKLSPAKKRALGFEREVDLIQKINAQLTKMKDLSGDDAKRFNELDNEYQTKCSKIESMDELRMLMTEYTHQIDFYLKINDKLDKWKQVLGSGTEPLQPDEVAQQALLSNTQPNEYLQSLLDEYDHKMTLVRQAHDKLDDMIKVWGADDELSKSMDALHQSKLVKAKSTDDLKSILDEYDRKIDWAYKVNDKLRDMKKAWNADEKNAKAIDAEHQSKLFKAISVDGLKKLFEEYEKFTNVGLAYNLFIESEATQQQKVQDLLQTPDNKRPSEKAVQSAVNDCLTTLKSLLEATQKLEPQDDVIYQKLLTNAFHTQFETLKTLLSLKDSNKKLYRLDISIDDEDIFIGQLKKSLTTKHSPQGNDNILSYATDNYNELTKRLTLYNLELLKERYETTRNNKIYRPKKRDAVKKAIEAITNHGICSVQASEALVRMRDVVKKIEPFGPSPKEFGLPSGKVGLANLGDKARNFISSIIDWIKGLFEPQEKKIAQMKGRINELKHTDEPTEQEANKKNKEL